MVTKPLLESNFREIRLDTIDESVERLRQVIAQRVIPLVVGSLRQISILAPPMVAQNFIPPPFGVIQRHAFLELGIVIEGVMGMWWRGQFTLCPKGSLLIIPPRCHHFPHASLPQTSAHQVLWIIFPSRQCIVHQCAWRDGIHSVSTYCVMDDPDLIHLGRSIWREWRQQDQNSPLIVQGYLMALLGRLLKAPVRPAIPKYERLNRLTSSDEPLAQAVYQFLWCNYHRSIKLADISEAIGFSSAYLCRRFKELTGERPFQALRRIRLEIAKKLLALNLSVSTVAEMVGFHDALYFSKVFSQEFGMPPTAYQKQCKPKRR
ncbi:MAG: AraC family transcriptional regulator [Armatimonadetes bacterium]|nr:AraC family transcriptional regulator [Armatimonadota bacterium]MDW8027806.1 AraC family transcriptional regulator [Armatimonadota bacterium]